MTSLRELQETFARDLLADREDSAEWVVGTPEVDARRRLEVYRNAYYARLVEALETDFSVLEQAMGEERFIAACHDYIRAHPSVYRSLRWFGQDFERFLRTHPDYAKEPYLAEMAALEWAFTHAFDSDDRDPVHEAAMADIPPERWPLLRIELHPSMQRVDLAWNTLECWQSAKSEVSAPSEPQPLDEPCSCLIWRQELITRYRTMEPDEPDALAMMAAGASFAELCEQIAEGYDDEVQASLRAASLLKGWMNNGLVVGVSG